MYLKIVNNRYDINCQLLNVVIYQATEHTNIEWNLPSCVLSTQIEWLHLSGQTSASINAPFLTRVADRGNIPPKIYGISHSIVGEPHGNIWHCFSLGAIPINKSAFLPLWWVISGAQTWQQCIFLGVGDGPFSPLWSNLLASFTVT